MFTTLGETNKAASSPQSSAISHLSSGSCFTFASAFVSHPHTLKKIKDAGKDVGLLKVQSKQQKVGLACGKKEEQG